jgi:hypothetical protein
MVVMVVVAMAATVVGATALVSKTGPMSLRVPQRRLSKSLR